MLDVKPIVALAHERGVPVLLDAYQAIGSLPIDVKALGVDFLAAGVLKYLLGSAGLGVPLLPARAVGVGVADGDRLVRRRERLRDGHPRLLARARRAPLPVGHAAGAVDLRRHRRDRADAGDRDRGDAEARAPADRAADRGRRRSRRQRSPRRGTRASAARSSASGRPTPSASSRSSATRGSSRRRATATCASRRTRTTRRRTSRRVLWELGRRAMTRGASRRRLA